MKAPNGEATNLTEDQWLTVRTPAFKAWFGDWEKASAAHEIHALIPVEVALSGKSLDKKTAEEVFSSFGEVENVRYGAYATFPKSMVGNHLEKKTRKTNKNGMENVFCIRLGLVILRFTRTTKKTFPLNVSGLVTRAKRAKHLLLITG